MNPEAKARLDAIRAKLDEARDALEELRDDFAHGNLPDEDGNAEYFTDTALVDLESALNNLDEIAGEEGQP